MLALLYLMALVIACTGAVRWGGTPERIGAVAVFVASVLTAVVQGSFSDPEYGVIAVDVGLLIILLWLALSSDRYWPMPAAAFHLVGMSVHLTKIVDPTVWWRAYLHANAFWAYPVLLALALGAWLEGPYGPRRQKRT